MSQAAKAVIAMVAACAVWGFSALYYDLLTHIPPSEVLAHRTLWSFVIFGALVFVLGKKAQFIESIRNPKRVLLIFCAGVMIAVNWYVFIFSVAANRVTESSLGYYFFPLVMVVLGWAFFQERHSRLQSFAVLLAMISVGGLTVAFGGIPWLALIIAGTFGLYGILKRVIATDPFVSVTLEVALLIPIALVFLVGWGTVPTFADTLLLVFSGVITAGPLVLMTYATRSLRSATVGILQYLNPILQYFTAVALLGEVIGLWHVASIGLIWIALALYSMSVFKEDRKVSTVSSTDVQT